MANSGSGDSGSTTASSLPPVYSVIVHTSTVPRNSRDETEEGNPTSTTKVLFRRSSKARSKQYQLRNLYHGSHDYGVASKGNDHYDPKYLSQKQIRESTSTLHCKPFNTPEHTEDADLSASNSVFPSTTCSSDCLPFEFKESSLNLLSTSTNNDRPKYSSESPTYFIGSIKPLYEKLIQENDFLSTLKEENLQWLLQLLYYYVSFLERGLDHNEEKCIETLRDELKIFASKVGMDTVNEDTFLQQVSILLQRQFNLPLALVNLIRQRKTSPLRSVLVSSPPEKQPNKPYVHVNETLSHSESMRLTKSCLVDVQTEVDDIKVQRFICEFCRRHFHQEHIYKRHLLMHSGKKTHQCAYCLRSFYDEKSYTYHLRAHSGEKPHQCSYCSMAFAKKSALEIHMRTHTGYKPYSCMHCHRRFSVSGNLQRHMIIHTGLKPFECGKCSKAFNNPSHLTRHITKVHFKESSTNTKS